MADPATLGAITLGTTAAGGLISGLGAKTSADATAEAYQYKAGVALINKQIAEQNAKWAIQAGEISAEESGMKTRQELGSTKAVQAASGLDVTTGSNERVRESQSEVGAFDQNVIRFDAAKAAYGYETKAATDQAESIMDMSAAESAKKAGMLGMLGSFLGTAGSVSSKWMQAKTTGMFAST